MFFLDMGGRGWRGLAGRIPEAAASVGWPEAQCALSRSRVPPAALLSPFLLPTQQRHPQGLPEHLRFPRAPPLLWASILHFPAGAQVTL